MTPVRSPRLVAIGSGKGGTGKTVLAANLARLLADQGERLLLCDCDLGLANTTVHLGLEDGGDLAGILAGTSRLDEAAVPVFGGVRSRGGFDLLAARSGCGALANLTAAGADHLIERLKTSSRYDRVLLDLGAGVGATTMRFAASAAEVMLVLTSDPASLTDSYAFVKLMLRTGAPVPAFVVNMAPSESDARQVADAFVATCRAFLKRAPEYWGVVPRDIRVIECLRRQSLVLDIYPQSPASRAVAALAERFREQIPQAASLAAMSIR